MKILIVNDDSISAPGIVVLAKIAAQFGEVTVAAPAEQCSAMSQKLTLRDPLTLEKVEDFPAPVKAAWKIGGTPVDCVKVALEFLNEMPDWIFSGINNGYNAGFDICYSGTLGAAFEAVRNGVPAMAFSIASEKHLAAAEEDLKAIISELLKQKPGRGEVWNVNFPPVGRIPAKGILRERTIAPTSMFRETYQETVTPEGTRLLTCVGRHTPDAEIPEGTDAKALRDGYISIGKVKCSAF